MSVKIFKNISELVTLSGANKNQGRSPSEKDLSIIKKGCMVSKNGKIIWRGKASALSTSRLVAMVGPKKAWKEVDLLGRVVLPGFVECHTHTVFGGHRADEFEMRNQGVSYQKIAQKGGGILSTVKQTRSAKFEDLKQKAQRDVDDFVRQGVTLLEIKSGYGLNRAAELKVLKIIRDLSGPQVVSTFLGAHAIPPEFKSSQDYLDYLESKVLPTVVKENLADRVDIFIEKGYFSPLQSKKYLLKAQQMGLGVTAHSEQMSPSGGFAVGLQLGAQSLDHLVELRDQDFKKMANSNTVSVLLPAADFYLKMNYPNARKLIKEGARVALSTDYNPGSSPTRDLGFVGLLARLEMKMSLPEVLVAYTLNGAAALGLDALTGSLEAGKNCDFCVLDDQWDRLFYSQGYHPVVESWRAGKKISKRL